MNISKTKAMTIRPNKGVSATTEVDFAGMNFQHKCNTSKASNLRKLDGALVTMNNAPDGNRYTTRSEQLQ